MGLQVGSTNSSSGGRLVSGPRWGGSGTGIVEPTPVQNHLVNSFKSLDPETRQAALSHLQSTGQHDTFNLLQGHTGDSYDANKDKFTTKLSWQDKVGEKAKSLRNGLISGAIDLGLASGGQTTGETTNRLEPTAKNPSGRVINTSGGHTNTGGEQVGQAAENAAYTAGGRVALSAIKGASALIETAKGAEKSTAGARIGMLNKTLEDNKPQLQLNAGPKAAEPKGLPSTTSVPYKSSKLANGGGVMVDSASPEAKVIANAGKPTLKQGTLLHSPEQAPTGRNVTDITPTSRQLLEGQTSGKGAVRSGKNVSDIGAPRVSDAQVVKAGQRIADGPKDPNVSTTVPKATKPLNELVDKVKTMSAAEKNGGLVSSPSSKIKVLNDIIEHPEASPTIKEAAIGERDGILRGKAKDQLAQDHSTQTGQPLQAAHETLKNGMGDHGPMYQALDHPAPIGHDVPTAWTKEQKALVPRETPAATIDRSAEAENAGKQNVIAAVKGMITPESRSRLSQETGVQYREAMARSANAKDSEGLQGKKNLDHFESLSKEDQVKDISNYERAGKSDLAPKGYDEKFASDMKAAHETGVRVLGEDKVGWVDNYVKRLYDFGSQVAEDKATPILTKLSGDRSFAKGRTLDFPLDEALARMKAEGIDVKPRVTNREQLRQLTVANAQRLEAYDAAFNKLKTDGVVTTSHIPGYIEIPRSSLQSLSPKNSATPHYGPEEVVDMLKNLTGKGLAGGRAYDAVRNASSVVTQVDLSLSGFHAGMTAVTNGVSHLADAILQVRHGDLKGAGVSLVKSIPGVGVTKNLIDGAKLRAGLRNGDALAIEKLNTISKMGGRLALQHDLKSTMTEKFLASYDKIFDAGTLGGKAKGVGGVILRSLPTLLQQTSRPLMEYGIPRVKDGMLLEQAARVAKQFGGLDSTEARIALAKAQSSIDNRMGEIVFDNKFWNKTAKDVSQVLYLSSGYRSGTLFELGGGLKDIATLKLTERSAFIPALITYVGTLGAVYHYLHTGQAPQEPKDYFYPKNGQKDDNGNDIRVALPSYFRDLRNMVTDPLKEVQPNAALWSTLGAEKSNKDYFGNEVRNPNDSLGTQIKQSIDYAIKQNQPISFQNSGKTGKDGSSRAESFFGITKAPASETQSNLQKEFNKVSTPLGPQTPEDQAKSQLKTKARAEIQKGITSSPTQDKLKGVLGKDGYKTFTSGADNPNQARFDKLPDEAKIKLISDLKPEDLKGINLDKFKTNSIVSLKAGTIKDSNVEPLKATLKKLGVDTTDKGQTQQILQGHKLELRKAYQARKGLGKRASQL